MSIIIVFTDLHKLGSVDETFSFRVDVNQIQNNSILRYDESRNNFNVATDFNISGLYFVQDTIPESNFITLMQNNKSNTFILKHRFPSFSLAGFASIREGAHESTGPYYDKLVAILMDDADDKIKRIIDKVFKYDDILEKKLELINQIWNGQAPNSLSGGKLEDFDSALTIFKNAIFSNDILSAECRAAFQDFKKALKLEE